MSTAEHVTEVRAQLWAHKLEMAIVEICPVCAQSLITILTFDMQQSEQASQPDYLYTLEQGLGGDRHVFHMHAGSCHVTCIRRSCRPLFVSCRPQFHEGAS